MTAALVGIRLWLRGCHDFLAKKERLEYNYFRSRCWSSRHPFRERTAYLHPILEILARVTWEKVAAHGGRKRISQIGRKCAGPQFDSDTALVVCIWLVYFLKQILKTTIFYTSVQWGERQDWRDNAGVTWRDGVTDTSSLTKFHNITLGLLF